MNNTTCEKRSHKYGLWSIKDNKGVRTCEICHYIEILPITDTINEQIKKQDEAKLFLKGFTKISPNDEKLLGCIDVMLDDYINYLSKENKDTLIAKINELKNSDFIDITNANLLTILESSYHTDINTYYDKLEQFKNYNQNFFSKEEHKK